MKTSFLLTAGLLALSFAACKSQSKPTARPDNSRTSVDWAGTYRGTLPCADCGGIETVLTLHGNGTYTLSRRYVGKEDAFRETTGPFAWNGAGSQITLTGDDATPFLVGENRLFALDKTGKRITGNLADRYVLTKLDLPAGLVDRYWRLTELMGQPVPPTNGPKEAHLRFHPASNRFSGNGGCNNLLGGFELSAPNRIRFSRVASTQMACPGVETEPRFLEVLERADSYFLRGDTLVLNRARMAPLARFVAVTR
jgi:heat shock protein HslJ